MKRILLILFFFILNPATASAYIPLVVTPESVDDIRVIEDPEVSQAFYGDLVGFPHMYQINATEPFRLDVKVRVPDIDRAKNNVSGIVLLKLKQNGVQEVSRLRAKEASWDKEYISIVGETDRKGAEFSKELSPGEYLIEMSTPDNLEPYVFVVGYEKTWNGVGYFEMVGRVIDVKRFLGKSGFSVVTSPLIYIPLCALILVGFGAYLLIRYRQKKTKGT